MNANSEIFYYLQTPWYTGGQPTFYGDGQECAAAKVLKENYQVIREEIMGHFDEKLPGYKTAYTRGGAIQEGWKTLNLYTYLWKHPANCKKFPILNRILNEIPGMCLGSIAVLRPNSSIVPHIGDTDGIVRHHLGIKIPAGLPETGFQVRREKREWGEGETMSFCTVHRHCAWNHTDQYRIILIVDTIREGYLDQKYEIAGKTLAVLTTKQIARKIPFLKRTPSVLTKIIHKVIGLVFQFVLVAEAKTGLHVRQILK